MPDLSFVTPGTIEEAVSQLSGDNVMAVGGGTSVGLLLKNRLVEPDKLVYLGRIPNLNAVRRGPGGELVLGATATLRDVAHSAEVNEVAPMLAYASSRVGNPRIRAIATIGGAVVHGDPRQDVPPVLIALGARLRVVGPGGRREIPMDQFFTGFMETALSEDELVEEVVVEADPSRRTHYTRFTPASDDDYPTVGVAAALSMADGQVRSARLALGGVASNAYLVGDADRILSGKRPGEAEIAEVARLAAESSSPSDDQRGSAAYKKAMVEVWTRRTLTTCLAD